MRMKTVTATPSSTTSEKQTYFLLDLLCCQLASTMLSRAALAFLYAQKSSSPIISNFSPCSCTIAPVSWITLCTLSRVRETLLIQSFLYFIILCQNSQERPRGYSLWCQLQLPSVLAVDSVSLWWVERFQVDPFQWGQRELLQQIGQKLVLMFSRGWTGVIWMFSCIYQSSSALTRRSFLRSFWILNCCLTVPILRAVSGSRQDCSNLRTRLSILAMLESMRDFYLLRRSEILVLDSTPMALLRQSLLFLSYLIRVMVYSQVWLNYLRIDNIYVWIYNANHQILQTISTDSQTPPFSPENTTKNVISVIYVTPIIKIQFKIKYLTMFDQQQQEQQPCVMCHQPNEQMLMLSCVHDPCIDCAAAHYVQNQPHNSPIYTCSKCGQETELDKSSIVQLQRLYNTIKKKNTKVAQSSGYRDKDQREPHRTRNPPADYGRGYQDSRASKYQDSRGSKLYQAGSAPVSQPSYTGSKKTLQHQSAYPCADHPDEELTYYCFTCNRPICPECAIHGLHRDHEVQTTRKAIKQIKQLLVEDRQKLDQEMSEIAGNREQAKRLSKEWMDENKRDQEFIRKKLSQFKALVNEKEKQLLRGCDSNLQKNHQILKNQTIASQKTLDTIAIVKRNIDNTLKKEDLTVLQEFNRRDEQANQALQVGDREREGLREQQMKNPLRCVDTVLLDEELDRLMADLKNLKIATVIPKS